MSVVTRFAPSPTGYLHIGGVRTALFNWLFTRHHGGKYLLRIEDTDKERSTQGAVDAILDGLAWMGLDHDEPPVFQSTRADRHREVVAEMLAQGKAYKCFATPEELAEMRETAKAEGRNPGYDGRWRDRDPSEAPAGAPFVVRVRTPLDGSTVIEDVVQGRVEVQNGEIDDFVLLRGDGSPTYMLAVCVDDHDMGVTHVIRGDDHLNNAFRQAQIYAAAGWDLPAFGHIPLIHGADGAKLSKRHGAVGVEEYRERGYLVEAVFNALLRLGWSHGDDEIISREQAIEWFDLADVNRGASRLDMDKMLALNAHYLKEAAPATLLELAQPFMAAAGWADIDEEGLARLQRGMPAVADRAKTLADIGAMAKYYLQEPPIDIEDKAQKALSEEGLLVVSDMAEVLAGVDQWTEESIKAAMMGYAEAKDLKVGKVFQPLRAALTGAMASPGVTEVAFAFGREKTLRHLQAVLA
ncbi:MAG: glutamate--tRNA ligase [Alphaproteobacteria bacterium TMED89]|nr:glutamate--tRNA ligase [Rhodospirillaceae bacterium]RPH13719.1 MAG: glutamate--tRNA ligase [Alphaproteobacteria bacterium TMED89]